MSNVVLNILSEFKGKKAFKEADSAVAKLEKSAKHLGAALGVSLSTAAVVAFGKASVKAFADDQKSATILANTIKNLGLSFEQANVEGFIKNLERTAGILDETLRPAMQQLLTTTGDVAKSQKILTDAVNISRGAGVDLQTTVYDLSLAYIGQTKNLKKYATGLSNAQLKAMSFEQILAKLNGQFAGSNAAYLETWAGRLDAINVAYDNLKETVGQSLVNAFMELSGATSTSDLVNYIDKVAERIANLITSVEKLGFELKYSFNIKNIGKSVSDMSREWEKIVQKRQYASALPFDPTNNALMGYKKDEAAKKKAQALAAANAKALAASLKTQKALTAEQKKQAALKKAGTIFDMDQIQLIAALKGKLSDEDRKRAELQLAILNENVDLVAKLSKDVLMAQDSTGKLYQYFLQTPDAKNPFGYLDQWIKDFQTKLNALQFPDLSKPSTYIGAGMDPTLAALGVVAGYGAGTPMTVASQASSTLGNGSYGMQSTAGFVDTSAVTGTNVKVYVSGSVVTEQELIDAIQSGLQSNSLSGAPSQIGRIAGMFG
jgi:hypothetical protein